MGGMTTSAISPEAELTYRRLPLNEILEDLGSRFIVNLPKEELGSITRIGFQVEQAHWFYEDFLRPINPSLPSLSLRNFSSQLLRTASHTVPLIKQYIKSPSSTSNGNGYQDLEAAFEEFIMYKTRVPVCGIILINKERDKCLLVKGWKSNSTWGFPKGKINQSEPKRDCAIREVFEETGFDSTELLKENSKDYMDLTMKDQKIRLYIVDGVDEDTVFETRTRKEISKIAWFPLDSLPTWKKTKSATDLGSGKFYMVSPFVARLKQWVKANKNRPINSISGGFGINGGVAQGEDGFQGEDDDDESFERIPTEPAAFRNRTVLDAPKGPAAERSHHHHHHQQVTNSNLSQPTSEGLKALLGFSSTPESGSFASTSKETLDLPFKTQIQIQSGNLSYQQSLENSNVEFNDPLFNGKGSNMIQNHSDPRSTQLLELLRGAAQPAINSEIQNQNQNGGGGSRAWEDVQRDYEINKENENENGSTSLLKALRAGAGEKGVSVSSTNHVSSSAFNQNQNQNQSFQIENVDSNHSLLNLLNGNSNPVNPMNSNSNPNLNSNGNNISISSIKPSNIVSSSSDSFNPYPSTRDDLSTSPQTFSSHPNINPNLHLQPRPPPSNSPLPAPRAHNVALAQSLLKMMSPAQGSFSFSMPPASSPDVRSRLNDEVGILSNGDANGRGGNENGNRNQNQNQVESISRERNRASDGEIVFNGEEEAEREKERKRVALLANLMGGLSMSMGNQSQFNDENSGNQLSFQSDQNQNQKRFNQDESNQARILLNLLNPSIANGNQNGTNIPHSSHPQQTFGQSQQNPQPFSTSFSQNQSDLLNQIQGLVHQQQSSSFNSTASNLQPTSLDSLPSFNQFSQASPETKSSPAAPLSDREQRLREAQNRDRAMNFKFPQSSNGGSTTSSPQQGRRNQVQFGNEDSRNSNGLLSLLNSNAGGGNGSNVGNIGGGRGIQMVKNGESGSQNQFQTQFNFSNSNSFQPINNINSNIQNDRSSSSLLNMLNDNNNSFNNQNQNVNQTQSSNFGQQQQTLPTNQNNKPSLSNHQSVGLFEGMMNPQSSQPQPPHPQSNPNSQINQGWNHSPTNQFQQQNSMQQQNLLLHQLNGNQIPNPNPQLQRGGILPNLNNQGIQGQQSPLFHHHHQQPPFNNGPPNSIPFMNSNFYSHPQPPPPSNQHHLQQQQQFQLPPQMRSSQPNLSSPLQGYNHHNGFPINTNPGFPIGTMR